MLLRGMFVLAMALPVKATLARAEPLPPVAETVVLLHGIGSRSWEMARIEADLSRAGYRVLNLTYPSRELDLEKLGGEWLPAQLQKHHVSTIAPLNFVTHSMGGIVVRSWLKQRGAPANLRRVVMITPPNAGSAVADRLSRFAWFRWFWGANGQRLGTGADSLPRSLGPWPAEAVELGIIAGDRALNPVFSHWLAEPNDGSVTVASARLAGMADFRVLHHSHTVILWRRETLTQIRAFLHDGRFAAAPPPTGDS